jgi:ferredoxin
MPEGDPQAVITVDRDVCMGAGTCIMYAPGTFSHDGETKAVVIDVHGDPLESIQTAVEACPTGALTLSIAGEV